MGTWRLFAAACWVCKRELPHVPLHQRGRNRCYCSRACQQRMYRIRREGQKRNVPSHLKP